MINGLTKITWGSVTQPLCQNTMKYKWSILIFLHSIQYFEVFNLKVTLDYLSLRSFDFILHKYLWYIFKISFWHYFSLRTRFSSNRLTNSPRAEANERRYYLRLQPWRMFARGSVKESPGERNMNFRLTSAQTSGVQKFSEIPFVLSYFQLGIQE